MLLRSRGLLSRSAASAAAASATPVVSALGKRGLQVARQASTLVRPHWREFDCDVP